jgi:hypothetical protein
MNRVYSLLMIAACIIGCQIIGVSTAYATDVTVTCAPPTQNTDGSTLMDLSGFKLYGGKAGDPKTLLDTRTACSFVRSNVAAATHEYYVTVFNSKGVESDPSKTVSITVSPPPPPDGDADGIPDATDQCPTVFGVAPSGCPLKPNPPPSITVQQLLAYEMRGSAATKDLRMVSVGVVPEGTACLQTTATVGGKTYYQLPKASVDLYNAPLKLPPIVWGLCG